MLYVYVMQAQFYNTDLLALRDEQVFRLDDRGGDELLVFRDVFTAVYGISRSCSSVMPSVSTSSNSKCFLSSSGRRVLLLLSDGDLDRDLHKIVNRSARIYFKVILKPTALYGGVQVPIHYYNCVEFSEQFPSEMFSENVNFKMQHIFRITACSITTYYDIQNSPGKIVLSTSFIDR